MIYDFELRKNLIPCFPNNTHDIIIRTDAISADNGIIQSYQLRLFKIINIELRTTPEQPTDTNIIQNILSHADPLSSGGNPNVATPSDFDR